MREKESPGSKLIFGQSESQLLRKTWPSPSRTWSRCQNKRRKLPTKVCFHGDFISFAEALPPQISLCWNSHSEVTRYTAPDPLSPRGDLTPLSPLPGQQAACSPTPPLKRPFEPFWRERGSWSGQRLHWDEPSTSKGEGRGPCVHVSLRTGKGKRVPNYLPVSLGQRLRSTMERLLTEAQTAGPTSPRLSPGLGSASTEAGPAQAQLGRG